MRLEAIIIAALALWPISAAVFVWARAGRGAGPTDTKRHTRARLVALTAGAAWIVGGWVYRVQIWRSVNAAPDCCFHPDLAIWLALLTAPLVGAAGYFLTR